MASHDFVLPMQSTAICPEHPGMTLGPGTTLGSGRDPVPHQADSLLQIHSLPFTLCFMLSYLPYLSLYAHHSLVRLLLFLFYKWMAWEKKVSAWSHTIVKWWPVRKPNSRDCELRVSTTLPVPTKTQTWGCLINHRGTVQRIPEFRKRREQMSFKVPSRSTLKKNSS